MSCALTPTDISDTATMAVQVYLPPWEVARGLNVCFRLDPVHCVWTTPVIFPQLMLGSTTRWATTDTEQVREKDCPAVEELEKEVVTTGGWSAGRQGERKRGRTYVITKSPISHTRMEQELTGWLHSVLMPFHLPQRGNQ